MAVLVTVPGKFNLLFLDLLPKLLNANRLCV